MKENIQEFAGPLQTATGLKARAEAAIHSVRLIFEDSSTEAVILVDASNAFKSINRKVALHNIQVTCLSFIKILMNTYRSPSRLIILCGAEIQSTKGTTQGDSLAMTFYALAKIEMQNRHRITASDVNQVWLAYDAAGARPIESLKKSCINITEEGGCYGNYVNERKSWLILKAQTLLKNQKVCLVTPK